MSYFFDHGGNVFTVARNLGISPGEITDFSASINPLGFSPLVREAIICSLDSLMHYPDSSHWELKQSLASYHGLSPANFAIANGSTETIYQLPGMLSGKRALIISPAFSEYVRSLNQHQWEIRHFILSPDNNFALEMGALEHALAKGCDTLYLCNPGNPAGCLYPPDIIEKVYGLCMTYGTFLVLDEAFMDFCEDDSAKQIIVNGDKGIVLRSMTKFFGIPGLRLGYAIACDSLAARLDAMGGPWSVNTPALAAGVAALADTQHNRQTIEFIQQERRNLSEQLSRFPMLKVYPSNANYVLVEITGDLTATGLKERLEQMRILIRDCATFMGLSPSFFRIAVRTREENELLLGCLRIILQ
jgi:threonine-phosphate decarboxylase